MVQTPMFDYGFLEYNNHCDYALYVWCFLILIIKCSVQGVSLVPGGGGGWVDKDENAAAFGKEFSFLCRCRIIPWMCVHIQSFNSLIIYFLWSRCETWFTCWVQYEIILRKQPLLGSLFVYYPTNIKQLEFTQKCFKC